MKRVFRWLGVLLVFIAVGIVLGPKPDYPQYDLKPVDLKIQLANIDAYIADKEAQIPDLKPDNEARVVWYQDSIRQTEYSLVYLHGFSSSQGEGDPVHKDFASRYGMNMYLARLADHGRETDDTFKGLTPKDLINSAKEAIAIGALIGKKVVVMSCSTGGTYSAMLVPSDSRIVAQIMYSPNIALSDPTAQVVTYPWGEQILQAVLGGKYNRIDYPQKAQQYWNSVYHTDGIVALQALIDDGMKTEYFKEITVPTMIGCYYKNEAEQDQVVSVSAMRTYYNAIATPADQKMFAEFPNAGRHVFTSHIMVDSFSEVKTKTYHFAETILGLHPLEI